ncbi:MAG: hypothetical protein QW792_03770 [Pyrobaculum sp.]
MKTSPLFSLLHGEARRLYNCLNRGGPVVVIHGDLHSLPPPQLL